METLNKSETNQLPVARVLQLLSVDGLMAEEDQLAGKRIIDGKQLIDEFVNSDGLAGYTDVEIDGKSVIDSYLPNPQKFGNLALAMVAAGDDMKERNQLLEINDLKDEIPLPAAD